MIVIGGGAAGFFAAINLAVKHSDISISILEKSDKLLSKVRISGGGRCNVTHHCFDRRELVKNYPRGHKELLQVFSRFDVNDCISWFEKYGVRLKTESDDRMFPVSDSSQTIIDCFLKLASDLGITIKTRCEVFSIHKKEVFELKTPEGIMEANALICATGGHPKAASYSLIAQLGHRIEDPVPSLFTLNLPHETIKKELQGVSVNMAEVSIAGSKTRYAGPVLITHWGLSGPGVLKLSAFAAKEFHDLNYHSQVLVNWAHPLKQNEIEEELLLLQKEKSRSLPFSNPHFELPRRLWEFLCMKAGIDNTRSWAETGKSKLIDLATNIAKSRYEMEGKTTFKEEFVTCGGIKLNEVDFRTMQSKLVPGLFFCGEVLNIDGITGGFNFQAAWSTAWICAQSA